MFLTPIYHLNVNPYTPTVEGADPLGNICINPLGFWNNNSTFIELISNIYSLFYYADPEYAYRRDRVFEYKHERDVYKGKIKYFKDKYVKPNNLTKTRNRNHDWDFEMN